MIFSYKVYWFGTANIQKKIEKYKFLAAKSTEVVDIHHFHHYIHHFQPLKNQPIRQKVAEVAIISPKKIIVSIINIKKAIVICKK